MMVCCLTMYWVMAVIKSFEMWATMLWHGLFVPCYAFYAYVKFFVALMSFIKVWVGFSTASFKMIVAVIRFFTSTAKARADPAPHRICRRRAPVSAAVEETVNAGHQAAAAADVQSNATTLGQPAVGAAPTAAPAPPVAAPTVTPVTPAAAPPAAPVPPAAAPPAAPVPPAAAPTVTPVTPAAAPASPTAAPPRPTPSPATAAPGEQGLPAVATAPAATALVINGAHNRPPPATAGPTVRVNTTVNDNLPANRNTIIGNRPGAGHDDVATAPQLVEEDSCLSAVPDDVAAYVYAAEEVEAGSPQHPTEFTNSYTNELFEDRPHIDNDFPRGAALHPSRCSSPRGPFLSGVMLVIGAASNAFGRSSTSPEHSYSRTHSNPLYDEGSAPASPSSAGPSTSRFACAAPSTASSVRSSTASSSPVLTPALSGDESTPADRYPAPAPTATPAPFADAVMDPARSQPLEVNLSNDIRVDETVDATVTVHVINRASTTQAASPLPLDDAPAVPDTLDAAVTASPPTTNKTPFSGKVLKAKLPKSMKPAAGKVRRGAADTKTSPMQRSTAPALRATKEAVAGVPGVRGTLGNALRAATVKARVAAKSVAETLLGGGKRGR